MRNFRTAGRDSTVRKNMGKYDSLSLLNFSKTMFNNSNNIIILS